MFNSKFCATLAIGMLLGFALPAKAEEAASTQFKVADAHRAAPEITGVTKWLNSEPLRMADLRGKVVLVDFWTHGCINCVRTLPYVTKLYEKYRNKGLVIIGVHTPEFAFERQIPRLDVLIGRRIAFLPIGTGDAAERAAISREGIRQRQAARIS